MSLEGELAEIRERLARLEEKVDWLIRLYQRRNNDKYYRIAFITWLSFLSAITGWLVAGGR